MSSTQTIRGTLKPDGTVELENQPNLPAGPVEVVLRPLSPPSPGPEDWWQYLQRVRREAEAAGGPFRSEGEIEQQRRDFRLGDERIEQIHKEIEKHRQGKSTE